MSYCAYITRIKTIRKHSNADRLQVATVFGNDVIVGLDVKENDLMVYFPTDGRLNIEYCRKNKLLREKDAEGNNIGGYMEESKCHVTTIKLRGERSDGLLMPLSSLDSFTNTNTLKEGDTITTLGGILICEKYIPRSNKKQSEGTVKTKKKKVNKVVYPFFDEHIDTSQLAYNTQQFKEGDLCYITLKMHGTSQRTANTLKEENKKLPYLIYKGLQLLNINIKPKKTWDYVSGTRRTVLKNFNGGYYGNDGFRQHWHDFFVGKLRKGEEVFYEVVGYTQGNQTIMPECSNTRTKDKQFIKQYGNVTRFTYGCDIGQNDIYVYRMTMTNDDGSTVEYPWHLVKLRCEQMGVKYCPEFDKFIFTSIDDLMQRVNNYCDGIDPVGKTHIREGVVVRVDNKEKFTAFKHKNFNFKVLEGIIKADDVLDMEEAS